MKRSTFSAVWANLPQSNTDRIRAFTEVQWKLCTQHCNSAVCHTPWGSSAWHLVVVNPVIGLSVWIKTNTTKNPPPVQIGPTWYVLNQLNQTTYLCKRNSSLLFIPEIRPNWSIADEESWTRWFAKGCPTSTGFADCTQFATAMVIGYSVLLCNPLYVNSDSAAVGVGAMAVVLSVIGYHLALGSSLLPKSRFHSVKETRTAVLINVLTDTLASCL